MKIYSFDDALELAQSYSDQDLCTKKKQILLGNGFSQAYYGDFSYKTLFSSIQDTPDFEKIKKIFDYFRTSNFEEVLSFLKHSQFLCELYGFDDSEIKKDYIRVRDALATALVKVHPGKTSAIPKENKLACFNFLNQFDSIYTVNYDLLLYWTLLQDPSLPFGDYFYRDEDTPSEYCEYFEDGSKSDRHVFFLHGALHLFVEHSGVIKKVWGGAVPLIEQIKEEINKDHYPLVVAEGDSDAKLNQIKNDPYLHHIFSKFSKQTGQLFTFGFSFSEQDNHILNAIAKNPSIRYLWVGLRGDFEKQKNKDLVRLLIGAQSKREEIVGKKEKKSYGPLNLMFFDSGSMNIWDN